MGTIEMEIPVHIHKTHALGGSDLPTHPFGHGTSMWQSLSEQSLDRVWVSFIFSLYKARTIF